jgi:hypothetical protein
MKNSSIYYLVIIGIVLVALAITNPPLEKQKELLVKKMISDSEKVKKDLAEKQPDNALDQMANELGQQFLQPDFINNLVNNSLSCDNYLFFSLPRMTVMSKTKIIGVGFAGNVIWFDEIKKPNQNNSPSISEKTETKQVEKVSCTEEERKVDEAGFGTDIKTCVYKNVKIVEENYYDYADRFNGSITSIFVKQSNGNYVKVKNEDIFNQNKQELLSLINSKLEKEFNINSKDTSEYNSNCYEGTIFERKQFDDLHISISGNGVFGFDAFLQNGRQYCREYTTVSFTFPEIQKYLNIDNTNNNITPNFMKYSQLRGLLINSYYRQMVRDIGKPDQESNLGIRYKVYIYKNKVIDDRDNQVKHLIVFEEWRRVDEYSTEQVIYRVDCAASGEKIRTVGDGEFVMP